MADAATWTAIVGAITTLLGSLGGYWLAGRNEESRDRRASEREAVARKEAFAERLEEQRHTFQRDTLLALQDELQHMLNFAGAASLEHQNSIREHGQIARLSPELNNKLSENFAAIQRLRSRVLDSKLRDQIRVFADRCSVNSVAMSAWGKESADTRIRKLQDDIVKTTGLYSTVIETLGKQLRTELDRRALALGQPQRGEELDTQR